MKRLFHPALFIALLCFQGCATRQELTLSHEVNVPREFRLGNFSEEHPGYEANNSAVERYVWGYERGWALAAARYANDINFDDPSPAIIGGWVEEQAGGAAGYTDARDRIELLIRLYGKQKVSSYLQEFRPELSGEP